VTCNSSTVAALCADANNGVVLVGLFFVVPCTDSFVRVDLRTVSFDIPPQEVCMSSVRDLRINLTSYTSKCFTIRTGLTEFQIVLI